MKFAGARISFLKGLQRKRRQPLSWRTPGAGRSFLNNVLSAALHFICERCFLLKGTDKAILIDTGMNIHHIREKAEALARLPVLLLNTHADRDHIGCNEAFDEFYMHPDDAAQYRESGKGVG